MRTHRSRLANQFIERENLTALHESRNVDRPRPAIRRDVRRTLGADVGERIRRDETTGFEQRQIGDEAGVEAAAAELDAKRLNRRAGPGQRQGAEERAGGSRIGAGLGGGEGDRASGRHE